MGKITGLAALFLVLMTGGANLYAAGNDITIAEFRQMYDSLLSGKTLVTQSREDGMDIMKERKFGQAIGVGNGDFEVPIETVITKSKDGAPVETITISILDRVNDLGGQPIIYEETRKMSVSATGSETHQTSQTESIGLFRVSKNDKGGFDVQNFGLIPSVDVEGNKNRIAGSNIVFSCYPEKNLTKCVLTVRDFRLGPYKPLVGYTLKEPIGGDFVEISQEIAK
ncbi:MAG TPA: hypothetical protein VHC46_07125 [Thermodesulfobacteriota bacterium]|nr:hypothetical protein [Thermodesulfobacteriota bacterium]